MCNNAAAAECFRGSTCETSNFGQSKRVVDLRFSGVACCVRVCVFVVSGTPQMVAISGDGKRSIQPPPIFVVEV